MSASTETTLAKRIGAEVLRLRKLHGFTQETLAEQAAISVSFMSMIERGARVPHVPTLDALARALSTTPGALVDGAQSSAEETTRLTNFIRARGLSAEQVGQLESMARVMFPAWKGAGHDHA